MVDVRRWLAGVLALAVWACTPSTSPPTEEPREEPFAPSTPSVPVPTSGEVLPAQHVVFTPGGGGGTLRWSGPGAGSLPVTEWELRLGSGTPFRLPGTTTTRRLSLAWERAETLELVALSGPSRRSEPVRVEVRGEEPVRMGAWVHTGDTAERRVRVSLWRSTPLTVDLQARQVPTELPATLTEPSPRAITVGPEPVSVELTWNAQQDCREDHVDLELLALVGGESYGETRTRAWLEGCAATGMTSLLQTGESPSGIHAADVDGDGRMELIVAHDISPSLLVLFLNERGEEHRRRYVHVGRPSDWMFVRDINGDGRADIVLAKQGSAEVLVLLGESQRLFSRPRAYALGGPATSLVFTDLEGDGHFDLIGLDALANRYHVLGGQPDGSFLEKAGGALPKATTAMFVVDLQGNGRRELVFRSKDALLVWAEGKEWASHALPSLTKGSRLLSVDVDEDGSPELLELEPRDPRETLLRVLRLNEEGTFSRRHLLTVPVEVYGVGLSFADLDGDGRRDLFVRYSNTEHSLLCLQKEEGSCEPREFFHGLSQGGRDEVFEDLDGDGVTDLVLAVSWGSSAPGYIKVMRGLNRGEGIESTLRIENPVSNVEFLDLDGDGREELIIGATSVTLKSVGSRWEEETQLEVGGRVQALALGDFTGDGRADIAALNEHLQIVLLAGRGGRRFERFDTPLATLSVKQERWWDIRLQAGDFNHDGRDDLLFSGPAQGVVLLSSSSLGFTVSKPFGEAGASASVADFDLDGWPDVFLSGAAGLESHLSREGGVFVKAWAEGDNRRAAPVARDLDRDGLVDVVVGMTVFRALPDGRFRRLPDPLVWDGAVLAAGDWNGDGRADLISTHFHGTGTGYSGVWPQQGRLDFTAGGSALSSLGAMGAWTRDLDGDRREEILLSTLRGYENSEHWRLELFRFRP